MPFLLDPYRYAGGGGGGTPTDAEIETIVSGNSNAGMWVPRMFDQFISDPGFDVGVSNWSTVGNATLTHTGSAMSVQYDSGSFPGTVYTSGWTTVVGNCYQVKGTISSGTNAYLVKSDSVSTYNSNAVYIINNQGAGTYTGYFMATATTTYLHTLVTTGTVVFDDITVTEVDMGYGGPTNTADAPVIETNGSGDIVGTFSNNDFLTIDQTVTSDYSLMIRFIVNETKGIVVSEADGGSDFAGCWQTTSSSAPDANAGTPTYHVDGGSAVSPDTRDGLHDAINTNTWLTLRITSFDPSAWTAVSIFDYSTASFGFEGEVAGIIWGPTSFMDTNETDFLAYMPDLAS